MGSAAPLALSLAEKGVLSKWRVSQAREAPTFHMTVDLAADSAMCTVLSGIISRISLAVPREKKIMIHDHVSASKSLNYLSSFILC